MMDRQAQAGHHADHPEFVTFITSMNTLFADWQQRSTETLKGLQTGYHPKAVISRLKDQSGTHPPSEGIGRTI